MEENFDEKPNKKIEIVKGNPKELDISDVKDNLTFEVDNNDNSKKKNIIIPEIKKNVDDVDNNEERP